MQIELTLSASADAAYTADALGFLLHKHPARVHQRNLSVGRATVFFPETGAERCTAVLHVDVDPVALVRGKGGAGAGLLDRYVNDRPYVASSFLSVALKQSFAQSMAGTSKERQDLADMPLPFEVRVTPVACQAGETLIRTLFEPLGYAVGVEPLDAPGPEAGDATAARNARLHGVELRANARLGLLLQHLYVLLPVLDDAKHWWVDRDEIATLLDKGGQWLATHPARELIARRALKHRRELVGELLERLEAAAGIDSGDMEDDTGEHGMADGMDGTDEAPGVAGVPGGAGARGAAESRLERPVRLHDIRLDTVSAMLVEHGAARVLDLGCGEGRLIERLLRERSVRTIVGVDPSVQAIARAHERFRLEEAGEAMRERLSFRLGSLTYADRRWRGFDAATLIEVIEHLEPARLGALERSLFADARPALVVVTTPNADYNVLFETLPAGAFRHEDHRFEWSRAEFGAWCEGVAARHGYAVAVEPLGPPDPVHGAPSQLARFDRLPEGSAVA